MAGMGKSTEGGSVAGTGASNGQVACGEVGSITSIYLQILRIDRGGKLLFWKF